MSFIKLLQEVRKAEEKPSKGLTKKQKSTVAKKARAGKDIGKKGKGFEKVAAKAAKQYGSEEAGKRVAAAAMWKNIQREGKDIVREGLHEDILRDLGLFLGQASVSAAIASTLGFSWAKSLLAIPEFKEKWKNANTKESKIDLIKKYLKYLADPTNIGKYTQSNKLDEGNKDAGVTDKESTQVTDIYPKNFKFTYSPDRLEKYWRKEYKSPNYRTDSYKKRIEDAAEELLDMTDSKSEAIKKVYLLIKKLPNQGKNLSKEQEDIDASQKDYDKLVFYTQTIDHLKKKGEVNIKSDNSPAPKKNKKEEKKNILGEDAEDHEVSMAANSLRSIINSAYMLMEKLGSEERNIPGWIQDHITNAENFIDQAAQGFHELGGDGPNSGSMGKCMYC